MFGAFVKSLLLFVVLTSVAISAAAGESPRPLNVLLIASGCCHDYNALAPFLSSHLESLINTKIEVHLGLDAIENADFARNYDAVIYDVCEEDTAAANLDHVVDAVRAGKSAVMIHCSIHAFRNSPKVHEWETLCGMRSKVHDAFGPFTMTKYDAHSPITKSFPDRWTTAGDELYQTISIDPHSQQLLRAVSPRDGREHVVCWTAQFGKGRVFSTTLGHNMKTTATPEYLRLIANGLLWSCSKLNDDGQPTAGYEVGSRVGGTKLH
jgi:type 1 glutamine amidotransferase